MSKPGFSWLIVGLLGSLMLPGMGRAQAPEQGLTLELLRRIEQLELEVRYIRGELELYRHQVESLQRERAALVSAPPSATGEPPALADTPAPVPPPTVTAPPPTISIAPVTEPPPKVPAAPTTATTETERGDFDAALDQLRARRHPEAIADFQRFLQTCPTSRLAGDAQYWLGESYYRNRDYDAARETFINLGLRYPQSKRLPDALLKLGYIYAERGDTARAKEVLQKLIQVYPDSEAAGLAEQRLSALP